MKQLSIFNVCTPSDDSPSTGSSHWKMFVDGAARNNPGPAGAGIYILKDSKPVCSVGYFLGSKTNNEAEYLALLIGLFVVLPQMASGDDLHVISDSELLTKQINGEYRVKKPVLQLLHRVAKRMLEQCSSCVVTHVLRTDNKQADQMANEGIDKKILPPQECIDFLRSHGVSLL